MVIPFIIIFLVGGGGIAFCIMMLVLLHRATKKAEEERERIAKGIFQPVKGTFSHTAGLPIPPGTECLLSLTESGLAISSFSGNFNISIDKLMTITSKTDTEIQKSKQYVSSAGGAVAGGMMLGAVGAMIGGKPKEKESTVTTYKNYMAITYKKEDSIDYLLFELSGTPMQVHPFSANFGILTRNRPSETIEL